MSKAIHEFHGVEIPNGVTLESAETEFCKCQWVQVLDENGAEAMGKPIGNYLTIETNVLEHGGDGNLDEIVKTVTEYLMKMMNLSESDSVLVVGLGNRNIIADSLGVRAADKVCATRHFSDDASNKFGKAIRPVSVISPCVMGITGISTAEFIKSISTEIKPNLVILIDSLAAKKMLSFCSQIQITDTGLTPGSGLSEDNANQAINSEFLGVPVISIGLPTVISATTIMVDFLNLIPDPNDSSTSQDVGDSEGLGDLMRESIKQYADEFFKATSSFVAAKEVDAVIFYSSYVISSAINMALFQENPTQMLHNL